MPVRVPPKRPIIYMPRWDVKLAVAFTKRNFTLVGTPDRSHDIVCLVDGPPVSPFLYGQRKIVGLTPDLARDREEMALLRKYGAAKPKIGFGRGAHVLNIYNGGSAWQRVTDHGGGVHRVESFMDGTIRWITTNHMQTMLPCDSADVLAVVSEGQGSRSYTDDVSTVTRDKMDKSLLMDVEACYYAHSNSLCFQPSDLNHKETADLFFELAEDNLINLPLNCTMEP